MAIRAYTVQTQAVYQQTGVDTVRDVSQSLSLSQEGGFQTTIRVYTVQTQVVYKAEGEVITQGMGLSDEALVTQLLGQNSQASDSLNLTQTVELNLQKWPDQSLDLVQTVSFTGPVDEFLQQTMFLQQSALGEFGLRWAGYEVNHDLSLTQSLGQSIPRTVAQSLSLVQDTFPKKVVEQELSLTQLAEFGFGFTVTQELDLTDSTEVDAVLNQLVSHSLDLDQSVAYFVESRCGRLERNDFHGAGGVAPSPQRLSYQNTFIIWSKDDVDDIVELRNPETDDRRRYSFQRVNRDLFDGTLDLYADDSWSTEERQIYTIVALKRSILDDLFRFLDDHLGRQVYIKDWKGTTWLGIITNPGEVYTEDAEGFWTIDFEIQAEPLPGEGVGNDLEIDQSVDAQWIYTREVTDDLNLQQAPHAGGPVYVEASDSIPFQQGA